MNVRDMGVAGWTSTTHVLWYNSLHRCFVSSIRWTDMIPVSCAGGCYVSESGRRSLEFGDAFQVSF
jgi:hypothetical protein